jgi:hypothetical protein
MRHIPALVMLTVGININIAITHLFLNNNISGQGTSCRTRSTLYSLWPMSAHYLPLPSAMVHIYNSGPSDITTWRINILIVGIYANALLLAVAVIFLKQILEAMKQPQQAQQQQQQSHSEAAQKWKTEQQQEEEEETRQQQPMPDRAINKPSGLIPLGGGTGRRGLIPLGGWRDGTRGSKRHIQ